MNDQDKLEYPMSCVGCGKIFIDKARIFRFDEFEQDIYLCSQDCAGRWLWENYPYDEISDSEQEDEPPDDWSVKDEDKKQLCNWCDSYLVNYGGGFSYYFGSFGRRSFCCENCAEHWLYYNDSVESIQEKGCEITLKIIEDINELEDDRPEPEEDDLNALFCHKCDALLDLDDALFYDGSYFCSMNCRLRFKRI